MKPTQKKQCTKCQITKSLTDFYKNYSRPGFFISICKKCKIQVSAEFDKKNPEQKRRRAREYARRKAKKHLK